MAWWLCPLPSALSGHSLARRYPAVVERYPKTEVVNLGRFISVMKFRPLIWQNTHPYLLADRLEDLTSPEKKEENPLADRKVCACARACIRVHTCAYVCVCVCG